MHKAATAIAFSAIVNLVPTITFAGPIATPDVEYRFEATLDGSAYVLDVAKQLIAEQNASSTSEKRKFAKIKVARRTLSIECILRCAQVDRYVEDLGNGGGGPQGSGLLGVFVARDDSDHIVTTWNNGHLYIVRIFGIVSGHMQKLLDEYSITMPSVVSDNSGMPLIELSDILSGRHITWYWSDHKYRSKPTLNPH